MLSRPLAVVLPVVLPVYDVLHGVPVYGACGMAAQECAIDYGSRQ